MPDDTLTTDRVTTSPAYVSKVAVFVCSLLCVFFGTANIYRYVTWSFLEPYFASCGRISLPPVLIAILGILYVFFNKNKVEGFAQRFSDFVLDSWRYVILILVAATLFVAYSLYLSTYRIPIRWHSFIDNIFLDGEQDGYAATRLAIAEIASLDKSAADELLVGLSVFEKREAVNHSHIWPPTSTAVILADKVKNTKSNNECVDYFLKFACAEAFSLAGDLSYKMEKKVPAVKYLDESRRRYNEFDSSKSPLVTQKWRMAARKNAANTCYYEYDWDNAVKKWSEIRDMKLPGSEKLFANIVAGLVQCHLYDRALTEGKEGIRQLRSVSSTQPTNYCALVENMLVASLAKGNYADSLAEYETQMSDTTVAPDGGLQAAQCLALLLANKIDEFENIVVHSDVITTSHKDLLIGLYHLKNKKKSEAIVRLRSYVSWPEDLALDPKRIHSELWKDFYDRGWTEIAAVVELIKPLNEPSPP